MKIGLIGAPGAGKTKFAKALAKEYDLTVVDNYAQKIQKDTNLALGPWVSHSENLMVVGARLAAEYKCPRDSDSVTVGTIVDSIAYAAFKNDVSLRGDIDGVRSVYVTAQTAMHALSLILVETWSYDVLFYLPFEEDVRRKMGVVWQTSLDEAYSLVIDSYQLNFTRTLHGSFKDRLEAAKETINLATSTEESEKEAADSSPAQTDERSDGARTGDGKGIGDSPISVPDL
jgi:hypothetical protein